jgi:replicative DNA helicase
VTATAERDGQASLIRPPAPDLIPAEQIVAGTAITSTRGAEAVGEVVRPEMFYRPAHRLITDAAMRLAEAGKDVDPVAVLGELSRAGDLRVAGGAPYLHELQAAAVAAPMWQDHGHRVAGDYRRRGLAEAAVRILQIANVPGYEEESSFTLARKLIDDATAGDAARGLPTMRELVVEALAEVENGTQHGLGLPWEDLDALLHGLGPGQLMYIAARPAVGKSIAGAGIAYHAAAQLGTRVLLVSMEMRAKQITKRLLSAEAEVPLHGMLGGGLEAGHWNALLDAAEPVGDSRLVIDDSPSASLGHIRARLRGMARTEPAGLLVIDYLGLMETPRAENRNQAVAELSRGLKILAGEFGIPVVCLAQLNRGPEQRHDHRPLLSDLRDSGAQEQDADVVILLHREDYYDPESPRAGEIDLVVAKNREGPTATVTIAFQGHYGRMTDMERV